MISFITWRLNFYCFKWWRRLNGLADPRQFPGAGQTINARRPTPFKAAQRDKYL